MDGKMSIFQHLKMTVSLLRKLAIFKWRDWKIKRLSRKLKELKDIQKDI